MRGSPHKRVSRPPQRFVLMILIFLSITAFCLLAVRSSSVAEPLSVSNNASPPSVAKDYAFTIIVFTYARPDGLQVTLKSILDSDYSKGVETCIDLEVFVDYPRSEEAHVKHKQAVTMQMLNNISWPYGRLRIHRRVINAGLRHSIMEAWYPASDREVAAFFEDDVQVSPYWFSWTYDVLTRYAPIKNGAIDVDSHFIGISLFRPIHDELSGIDVEVRSGNAPFLLQQPCSWGAVYFPQRWRMFRVFFDENKRHDIPVKLPGGGLNPASNGWDFASSWKKYLIYYMYVNGLYMVYPNFPNRVVLSTSRMLVGEHRTPPKSKFVLPILSRSYMKNGDIERSFSYFPQMNELKTYDIMFHEVAGIQALPNYGGRH